MNKAKLKWRVQEAPTGPYRSFHPRGWPSANYKNERQDMCGDIWCDDNYTPFRAKSGQHQPLRVRISDYSVIPFKWLTLKARFKTLAEAKTALAAFIEAHPEVMPTEQLPESRAAQLGLK